MRLTERIYLVGGGNLGFGISNDLDCHVYLVDGRSEMALIDAGAGVSIEPILENLRFDGLDPARLKYVLLTHAHADHAGGAFFWHERFGVEVAASPEANEYLSNGDEEKISLAVAKRGGFYPNDFRFQSCPVAHVLEEGAEFAVGDLRLRAIETPGHCSGMLSFLMNEGDRSSLFCGDTVFHGGKILVTNVWDCDVQRYVRSIEKLAAYQVDRLLPGHLSISLSNGGSHIRAAWQTLERLTIPANII
jgi:glyoxylase-like metal-dependent hydrolase (beta-lactamase superfamily II)